jgi:hypothetical protein
MNFADLTVFCGFPGSTDVEEAIPPLLCRVVVCFGYAA